MSLVQELFCLTGIGPGEAPLGDKGNHLVSPTTLSKQTERSKCAGKTCGLARHVDQDLTEEPPQVAPAGDRGRLCPK